MRKTGMIVSVVGVCLAVLVAGCSKKESLLVAKVGGEEITWDEFKDGFLRSPQYRQGREDSLAKRQYLDMLIERKLMIQEAYRLGLDRDDEVRKEADGMEKSLILRSLYDQEIVDKILSEKAVREFYTHSGDEVKARHILIKAPPEASPEEREKARAKIDSLLALAREGQDFAELAKEHSEDVTSARNGGDLGFFGWGKMVGEFQEAAFALQPGQISDVVETQYGYHIIQVEDKRKAERGTYEEMRDQIRAEMMGQKKTELQKEAEAYVERLKSAKNLTINEESLTLLSEKKRVGQFTADKLSEAEKSTILASFDGGEVTFSDYLEREAAIPPRARARATDVEGLRRQIEGMLVNEFLVEKAKDLGLDRAPDVREKVLERQEQLMAKQFRESVEDSVQITEEDVRAYFEQHKEDYIVEEQVNIQEILVKEKALAETLLKRMKRGEDIASLAKEHSERKWAAGKGGEFGFFKRDQYAPIGEEAFALKVGQFGGPLKVQNGYSVFKVIDRKEARPQTFEEARPTIETDLGKKRKQAAFEEIMARLKERTPVDINLDILAMDVSDEQS